MLAAFNPGLNLVYYWIYLNFKGWTWFCFGVLPTFVSLYFCFPFANFLRMLVSEEYGVPDGQTFDFFGALRRLEERENNPDEPLVDDVPLINESVDVTTDQES